MCSIIYFPDYIRGNASIDRNTDVPGGRAWCRYTNSNKRVFILDVAQGFIGRMEKAENWDYRSRMNPNEIRQCLEELAESYPKAVMSKLEKGSVVKKQGKCTMRLMMLKFTGNWEIILLAQCFTVYAQGI